MIRILVGFYGMVIAVACYIRYIMHIGTGIENGQSIWSKISKRVQVDRKPPKKMLPKNMIIAMAQRKIYQVQNYVDGPKTKVQKKSQKERWAKKMISNSSKKLDAYEPNAFELGKIVDKICDHIDKTVVESKEKLCELRKEFRLIKKQRQRIAKSMPSKTGKSNDQSSATPIKTS